MLGAMSTVADYRWRGIQAGLLADRRHRASRSGCDLVAATALAGIDSARDLADDGFTPLTSITTWAAPE